MAEPIVREWVEEDAEFRWVEGVRAKRRVQVQDLEADRVEEWADGSRIESRAAAATTTSAKYLGAMATVADAEAMGIAMAWEEKDVVGAGSRRGRPKVCQAARATSGARLGNDGVEGNKRGGGRHGEEGSVDRGTDALA